VVVPTLRRSWLHPNYHAVGRGDADGRRAPHAQHLDRLPDLFDGAAIVVSNLGGQQGLVEDADETGGIADPGDGAWRSHAGVIPLTAARPRRHPALGAMPTALRGHAGGPACPRKAVGMAPSAWGSHASVILIRGITAPVGPHHDRT